MKTRFGAMLLLSSVVPLAPAAAQFPGATIMAPCITQPNLSCTPVTSTNPLPITAPGGLGNTTDTTGSGTLALGTANATFPIALTGGRNTVGLTIGNLTGSNATITVERSNDGGTTWTNANTTESSATSSLSPTITANGQARVGVAGATNIRLRVSTAGTGTATVAYNATTAAGPVFLTSLLPNTTTPGTGVIGGVNNQMIAGATISVGSGVTDGGTQRVVLATDGTQATAGRQDTGNASSSAMANALGTTADAAATTADTTPASAIALWKEAIVKWNVALGNYQTIINQQTSGAQKTQIASSAGTAVTIRPANTVISLSDMSLVAKAEIEAYSPSAGGYVGVLGDGYGLYTHTPPSGPTAQGGTIAASGGTLAITFTNTSDTEIVNPSTATFWCSWGTPAVNGSGSYPIAVNGSYKPPSRPAGTFTCLSTIANQTITATRFQ